MTKQNRPDAEAIFFQGTQRMESGDAAGAEACFRQAVQIAPEFAKAYANLALLLDRKGNADAAEIYYRRSMELDPGCPEIHLNFGAFLANEKRFREAEAAYSQAILLAPHSPVGWSNMGALYACTQREAEAEQHYRIAMSLDESHAAARFNLSYLLLRQGRLEEGWPLREARTWPTTLTAHITCPRWQGEALAGKSILISYEAGHGDMLQFCRYASQLKAQECATITMICHPALKTLFAELDDVDAVISLDEPIPASGWDFWTPLLSLPFHCKTLLDSIPAKIPYLRVPETHAEKWRAFLPENGLRVGLVWKGNPRFENDADRSLPSLEVLAPLWNVAGVNFISLQKGASEDEAAHPPGGLALTNIGHQLEDFADTAAVVANLDLLICVDTAVAHLAGALGKSCWILLPAYKPDWRWLTDRTDSPWYPGVVQLFRQPAMGDWNSVVADVAAALEQLVCSIATAKRLDQL